MDSLKPLHVAGAVFTIIAGTLLHFVWEWSGYNEVVAVFGAVNESTWEHLKLLFFPFLLFTAVEYFFYGKHHSAFFPAKLRAVVLGMVVIVVVFYTYTGILGTNLLPLDIGTFVLGVVLSYRWSYEYLRSMRGVSRYEAALSFASLLLLAAAFGIFTFFPPRLGLFVPPKS